LADALPRALTRDEYEKARRTLMRRDPRLGAVIKRVGKCGLPDSRTHEPFAALVRVIMGQQLSGKAAETIYGRVVALAGGPDHMTPARIRALDAPALRAAGVSGQKIRYVYDLADHVADGRLDLHALDGKPDEEVLGRITAVKGLGRW
jgi:DNA-3-methyladenine glycosylase II